MLPFRGALVTVESMRGEYALCTRCCNSFWGAGAAVLCDSARESSQSAAGNLPVLRLPKQARLPYSSFRGAPQPNTLVTMRDDATIA